MRLAKKIICILLSVLLLLPLAACSDGTVVVARYKNTTVNSGMLSYMLSSQKAYLEQMLYYYYGTTDFDSVWSMEIGRDENGNVITYGDNAFESIVNALKMFVVVKQLCKEYGLTVTDQSTIDAIEGYISEDVETAGDMNFLEIALAEYGARVSDERDYLYTTSLTSVLLEYLFGDNGTMKIPDSEIRAEFEKTYTKIDMNMFSFTEKNDAGSYVERSDASLTDSELKEYFDDEYLKAEQILFYFYDVSDKTGQTKISEAEMGAKRAKAAEIFESISNGSVTFDDAKKEHNEDPGMFASANGDVLGKGMLNEKFTDFENKLFEMKVGDIVLVETDIGVHIVRRNEMGDSDFNTYKESIRKLLTQKKIAEEAEAFYAKLQSGSTSIDADTVYGNYQTPFTYASGDLGEDAEELISALKPGEYAIYTDESCVVVFRRLELSDDDYQKSCSTVKQQLSQDAFYDYIESLYSQVELNEEEIAKYTFATAKSLNISSYS